MPTPRSAPAPLSPMAPPRTTSSPGVYGIDYQPLQLPSLNELIEKRQEQRRVAEYQKNVALIRKQNADLEAQAKVRQEKEAKKSKPPAWKKALGVGAKVLQYTSASELATKIPGVGDDIEDAMDAIPGLRTALGVATNPLTYLAPGVGGAGMLGAQLSTRAALQAGLMTAAGSGLAEYAVDERGLGLDLPLIPEKYEGMVAGTVGGMGALGASAHLTRKGLQFGTRTLLRPDAKAVMAHESKLIAQAAKAGKPRKGMTLWTKDEETFRFRPPSIAHGATELTDDDLLVVRTPELINAAHDEDFAYLTVSRSEAQDFAKDGIADNRVRLSAHPVDDDNPVLLRVNKQLLDLDEETGSYVLKKPLERDQIGVLTRDENWRPLHGLQDADDTGDWYQIEITNPKGFEFEGGVFKLKNPLDALDDDAEAVFTYTGGVHQTSPSTALLGRTVLTAENEANAYDAFGNLLAAPKDPEKVFEGRRQIKGQHVGLSPNIKNAADLKKLRSEIKELAQLGAPGRFWYENTAEVVAKSFGVNIDPHKVVDAESFAKMITNDVFKGRVDNADRFLSYLAILSPSATVQSETPQALRAIYQHITGQPLIGMGTEPMRERMALLAAQDFIDNHDEFWKAFTKDPKRFKTNAFYLAPLRFINPVKYDAMKERGLPVIDMWMGRLFGVRDQITPDQYLWIAQETKLLGDELGWTSDQVQAALWIGAKAKHEYATKLTKKEVQRFGKELGLVTKESNAAHALAKQVVKSYKKKLVPEGMSKDDWIISEIRRRGTEKGLTEDQISTALWSLKDAPEVAAKQIEDGGKAINKGLGTQIASALRDFSHTLEDYVAQVSTESVPGTTVKLSDGRNLLQGIENAPWKTKMVFHQKVEQSLQDPSGQDLIALFFGLPSPSQLTAPGVWVKQLEDSTLLSGTPDFYINPSTQRKAFTPGVHNAEYLDKRRVGPEARRVLDSMAATRGIALKQDAVAWSRITNVKDKYMQNAAVVNLGRSLSKEETERLAQSLFKRNADVSVVATEDGAWLLNLNPARTQLEEAFERARGASVKKRYQAQLGTETDNFRTQTKDAIAEALDETDEVSVQYAGYDGNLIENDWSVHTNGEGYRDAVRRAGLHSEEWEQLADSLSQRVAKVHENFAAKQGWAFEPKLVERGDTTVKRRASRSRVALARETGDQDTVLWGNQPDPDIDLGDGPIKFTRSHEVELDWLSVNNDRALMYERAKPQVLRFRAQQADEYPTWDLNGRVARNAGIVRTDKPEKYSSYYYDPREMDFVGLRESGMIQHVAIADAASGHPKYLEMNMHGFVNVTVEGNDAVSLYGVIQDDIQEAARALIRTKEFDPRTTDVFFDSTLGISGRRARLLDVATGEAFKDSYSYAGTTTLRSPDNMPTSLFSEVDEVPSGRVTLTDEYLKRKDQQRRQMRQAADVRKQENLQKLNAERGPIVQRPRYTVIRNRDRTKWTIFDTETNAPVEGTLVPNETHPRLWPSGDPMPPQALREKADALNVEGGYPTRNVRAKDVGGNTTLLNEQTAKGNKRDLATLFRWAGMGPNAQRRMIAEGGTELGDRYRRYSYEGLQNAEGIYEEGEQWIRNAYFNKNDMFFHDETTNGVKVFSTNVAEGGVLDEGFAKSPALAVEADLDNELIESVIDIMQASPLATTQRYGKFGGYMVDSSIEYGWGTARVLGINLADDSNEIVINPAAIISQKVIDYRLERYGATRQAVSIKAFSEDDFLRELADYKTFVGFHEVVHNLVMSHGADFDAAYNIIKRTAGKRYNELAEKRFVAYQKMRDEGTWEEYLNYANREHITYRRDPFDEIDDLGVGEQRLVDEVLEERVALQSDASRAPPGGSAVPDSPDARGGNGRGDGVPEGVGSPRGTGDGSTTSSQRSLTARTVFKTGQQTSNTSDQPYRIIRNPKMPDEPLRIAKEGSDLYWENIPAHTREVARPVSVAEHARDAYRDENFMRKFGDQLKKLPGGKRVIEGIGGLSASSTQRFEEILVGHASRLQSDRARLVTSLADFRAETAPFEILENNMTRVKDWRGRMVVAPRGDVYSNPSAFQLSKAQQNYVDKVWRFIDNLHDDAVAAGVDIKELGFFERGEHYIPRQVIGVDGIDKPGNYVKHRTGAKQAFQKTRFYTSEAEGIRNGVQYAQFEEALESYAKAAMKAAADAEAIALLKPFGARGIDLVDEGLKKAREMAYNDFKAASKNWREARKNLVNMNVKKVREKAKVWTPSSADVNAESLRDPIVIERTKDLKAAQAAEKSARGTAGHQQTKDALAAAVERHKVAVNEAKDYVRGYWKLENSTSVKAAQEAFKESRTKFLSADAEFQRAKAHAKKLQREVRASSIAKENAFEAPAAAFPGVELTDDIVPVRQARSIPALNGTVFPKEVAEVLERHLGDEANNWLSQMNKVNDLSRVARTSTDFGAMFIQGIPVLVTNPAAWAKSVYKMFDAFRKPQNFQHYLSINREAIEEASRYIGAFSDNEYFRTTRDGGLIKAATKSNIPALRVAGRGVERFGVAFDAFLDVAKLEMWKAARPHMLVDDAIDPKIAEQYARFIRNATGTTNTARLAVRPGQRQLESLLAFSPRFVRSGFALSQQAMEVNTPAGRKALMSLGTMMFAGAALIYGVKKSMYEAGLADEDVSWKDFDPREGGRFMAVKYKDNYIGLGGSMRGVLQVAANSITTAFTKPGDFLSLDTRTNPILRYSRGKASPFAANVIDTMYGENYIGEETSWQNEWLFNLPEEFTPFALDSIQETKGNISDKALVFGATSAGMRAYPETASENLNLAVVDIVKSSKNLPGFSAREREEIKGWYSLTAFQKNTLLESNPQLRQFISEKEVEQQTEYQQLNDTIAEEKAKLGRALLESQEKQSLGIPLGPDDMTPKEYREAMGRLNDQRRALLNEQRGANPITGEGGEEFDNSGSRTTRQKIMDDFYDALDSSVSIDPETGLFSFALREEAESRYLSNLSAYERQVIEEERGTASDPVEAEFKQDKLKLRDYWEINDAVAASLGYEDADELTVLADQNTFSRFRKLSTEMKEDYRRKNRDIDAILWRWNYVSKPVAEKKRTLGKLPSLTDLLSAA